MIKHTFGKATDAQILEFEKRFKVVLPADYRQFLLTSNGAQLDRRIVVLQEIREEICPDVLFGFPPQCEGSLHSFNVEVADEVLEGAVVIGNDTANNLFVLDCSGSGAVYYNDGRHIFEGTSDENNTFLVAESFTEFLQL